MWWYEEAGACGMWLGQEAKSWMRLVPHKRDSRELSCPLCFVRTQWEDCHLRTRKRFTTDIKTAGALILGFSLARTVRNVVWTTRSTVVCYGSSPNGLRQCDIFYRKNDPISPTNQKKKKEREGIRLRTKSDLKVPTSIMCDLWLDRNLKRRPWQPGKFEYQMILMNYNWFCEIY